MLRRCSILTCALLSAACGAQSGAARHSPSIAPPGPASAEGTASTACALRPPNALDASGAFTRVPREVFERAVPPVLPALCACTEPGGNARVDLRIVPGLGEVRAVAPEDVRLDACLVARLNPGRFEPVDVPIASDCIDCGPRHVAAPSRPDRLARFGSPAQATPTAGRSQASLVVVYPLLVDRQVGEIRDAAALHVPRAEQLEDDSR